MASRTISLDESRPSRPSPCTQASCWRSGPGRRRVAEPRGEFLPATIRPRIAGGSDRALLPELS